MGRRHRKPSPQADPAVGGIGRRWLAAIFLTAMAYRGLCFWVVGGHVLFRYPVVDAGYHSAWAGRIVAGDRLGHGPDDVFKPPVYPYVLAGVYAVFGPSVQAAQWVQMVMGSASCVLLALLAGALLGRWPGRLTGLLAALYAPYVFFELQLLTPALVIFLNTLALLVVVRCWRRGGYGWLVVAGVLGGLSAGTRPDVLLPAALVGLYLFWRDRRLGWKGIASRAGCVLAGAAAALAPIAARNHRLTGEAIVVSSNAGINFYVGNAAGDGTSAVPVGLRWERMVSRVPQPTLEKPGAASRFWLGLALREMRARPAEAAGRVGRKALAFFSGREFRNNIDLQFMQRRAWPLGLPLLQYGMVLPLAAAGLVLLAMARRPQERLALGLCVAWTGGYWLVAVAFFVTARFRLPAVPLLMLPAGWALHRLVAALRRRERRPLLTAAAAILAAGALAWPPWFGRPRDTWVRDYVNLGNSLRQAGDAAAAARAYRQAVAMDAHDPDANYLLGRLQLPADPRAATGLLEAARRAIPDSPDLLLALGEAHLAAGRGDDAAEALHALLALEGTSNLWPKRAAWATAHVLLAKIEPASAAWHWQRAWAIDERTAAEASLLERKDLPRVLEAFRRQAERAPWDWYSQANHGLVLLLMDRPAEAVAPFRKAVRLAPQREPLRLHLARALLGAGRRGEALVLLDELYRCLPDGPLRRDVAVLRRAAGGAE